MNGIRPFVRHMILCDEARESPTKPGKVGIFGLLSAIRTQGPETSFPIMHTFTVYLMLTGGRGEGEIRIMVWRADPGERIYESPPYSIRFANDPLRVFGVVIHVGTCSFPQSGLYWVEFWYNEEMIAHEPLEVF